MSDLFPPTDDTAALTRLRERLGHDAELAGLLDVAYRTVDSPVGPLLVAATGRGLVRVAYASEGHDGVLGQLATAVSPRVLHEPRRLDPVTRWLDRYFTGAAERFDQAIDLSLARGFRLEVLRQLPTIDYGHTASYAEVARATGRPQAVRAVGTACARNPVPIVVPCHRVVRSDGSFGGYVGGAEAKRTLLELEGVSGLAPSVPS